MMIWFKRWRWSCSELAADHLCGRVAGVEEEEEEEAKPIFNSLFTRKHEGEKTLKTAAWTTPNLRSCVENSFCAAGSWCWPFSCLPTVWPPSWISTEPHRNNRRCNFTLCQIEQKLINSWICQENFNKNIHRCVFNKFCPSWVCLWFQVAPVAPWWKDQYAPWCTIGYWHDLWKWFCHPCFGEIGRCTWFNHVHWKFTGYRKEHSKMKTQFGHNQALAQPLKIIHRSRTPTNTNYI